MSSKPMKPSPEDELECLLSEESEAAKERARKAFDQAAGRHGSALVLFGAGNLGRRMLHGLRRAGIEPLAFSDNNAELWGTTMDGLAVVSPREAADRYGRYAAFVMTIWRGEGTDTMAERCEPLVDIGCEKVLNFGLLFWKFPEIFLPHYAIDLPNKVLERADEVRRAFHLWADEASRAEFVAQIRWRLHLDVDGLSRPVRHDIYFPDDLVSIADDERFVDCGAYDGDTVRSFLSHSGSRFGQIFAFEADPENFDSLRTNVSRTPASIRDKIEVYPLAVGARSGTVRFEASGTESSHVGRRGIEVRCDALDVVLRGKSPTWIKMDIEGSELDALSGARSLIAENAPVLAVCVYHMQDHVWRVPLAMQDMSAEYQFYLRPHLSEGWDLLCYAIPRSRAGGKQE